MRFAKSQPGGLVAIQFATASRKLIKTDLQLSVNWKMADSAKRL